MDLLGLFNFPKKDDEPYPPNQNASAPATTRALQTLLDKLADLKHLQAKDVMTPRALVEALDADVEIENMHLWKTSTTLYFPVYEGDLDHTLGWMSQETLRNLSANGHTGNLRNHFVPAHHIQENMPLDQVFLKFVQTSAPLIVVQNEAGTTTGILYLNDVLEAFFGVYLEPPEFTNLAHG